MESRENLNESSEVDLESGENSSDAWETWKKPFGKGPNRRRFVIAYYPNLHTGINTNMFWRGGRRRHQAIKPREFQRGQSAGQQDMYWDHGRIKNDGIQRCLDANRHHQDALYWHSCHNGGNQKFWTETRSGDRERNANHIVIGGNMGRRRRKSCVDYGGGRIYIHGCHNGDNQRFRFMPATTTTSTSTSTTTTTTVIPVMMKTFMLPEKIEWKIMRHGKKSKKQVCAGGKYSNWYSDFSTGCFLPAGTYTLHCKDQWGFGWSGGYIKIKGKALCKDFLW